MAKKKAPASTGAESVKIKVGWRVDASVWERARRAVRALEGRRDRSGAPYTMSALVERGLLREVRALEREHNGGGEFPPIADGDQLRTGARR